MSRAVALKLRPISNPKGDRNQYCGPAVVSSLTGMGTGEAARLIRAVSRKKAVKGTHDAYLLRALGRCGITVVKRLVFPGRKLTLAAWLRETTGKRGGKIMIVSAGHHYQLVSGNRFVCGQVKEIVGLEHPGSPPAQMRAVWIAGGSRDGGPHPGRGPQAQAEARRGPDATLPGPAAREALGRGDRTPHRPR